MRLRVYYEDTDTAGVVYYANYFKFIERARSELFFSRGLSPISEEGHFVVKSVNAEFLKSARFGEELDVTTSIVNVRSASVELKQAVFRGEEKLFEAVVKLAFLHGSKPCRIPQSILDIFSEV